MFGILTEISAWVYCYDAEMFDIEMVYYNAELNSFVSMFMYMTGVWYQCG